MITIGVLGANGQVGSEVSLLLSLMSDVRIIPICRTELAGAFLKRCGLKCRIGSVSNSSGAGELLEGCDLIADFSIPRGLPSETQSATRKLIRSAIDHAPPRAVFVYISSIAALGPGSRDDALRPYLFSKTVYGALKRYGERIAFSHGKRRARTVYTLRLGQVHGELQTASRIMMTNMRDRLDEAVLVPDGPSYTLFAYSIAEALRNIALGHESPGRYSLVSAPQWSWKEIYEFYRDRLGLEQKVLTEKVSRVPGWPRRTVSNVTRAIIAPPLQAVLKHKESIAAYVLSQMPLLEARAMTAYRRREAASEIGSQQAMHRPFDGLWVGQVPGPFLRSLSDSRTSMAPSVRRIREIILAAGGRRINSVAAAS
jgi:nucleoside-diphosphate-sugar epimerase